MQKFIRIMAIVAVALIGCSALLLLVSFPFQSLIAKNVYGYGDELLSHLPQFPLIPFLFCFLRLGCAVLLIVCCGNKKGGIWLELVALVCLAVILPGASRLVNLLYTPLIYRAQGSAAIAASSVVNNIANFCLIPGSFGQTIAYVVSGMSIVFKKMNKR